MEYHVAQLLREAIGSSREFPVCEWLDAGDGQRNQVEGSVRLLRTHRSILATARLAATLAVTCSRCLTAAQLPVQLDVEAEYYPSVDVMTGAPLPPPEDLDLFAIDQHHMLDLREAVRQEVVLAEPIQALCRPDCAGLCPQCGADLNRGACACAGPSDNRWSPLSALAARMDRSA